LVSLLYAQATTSLCPRSLHDALPIFLCVVSIDGCFIGALSLRPYDLGAPRTAQCTGCIEHRGYSASMPSGRPASVFGIESSSARSEEHTSELQSRENLVCRLLLEKKK